MAYWLVRLRAFRLTRGFFRNQIVRPRAGFRWLYRQMLKRQTRDGLHHAPGCPGNEWDGMELVFQ